MSPIVPGKRAARTADPAGELAWQIEHGLGLQVAREVKFHPTRKWRFDLVVEYRDSTDPRIAIEIEGGLFITGSGRHNRGAGMRNDMQKYNEAALLGWIVLRVLPEWVHSGQAFTWVQRAVQGREAAVKLAELGGA